MISSEALAHQPVGTYGEMDGLQWAWRALVDEHGNPMRYANGQAVEYCQFSMCRRVDGKKQTFSMDVSRDSFATGHKSDLIAVVRAHLEQDMKTRSTGDRAEAR